MLAIGRMALLNHSQNMDCVECLSVQGQSLIVVAVGKLS